MKKALVALIALAVTGALMAQDAPSLKFSGYLNSGLEADIVGSDNATLKAQAQDAGVPGYRMNLDVAYTNGSVGANVRLRSEKDSAYMMNYGYVWANLLGNMATVKAGKVSDGAWETGGDIGGDVGEGTGILLQVMPLEGLNFGAGVYAVDATGSLVEIGDAKYTVGFAYTMADTFGMEGSLSMLAGEASQALVGLEVLAVPQLSAALEYQADYLDDFSNIGLNTITETVSYDFSPINVGVTAYEWISQVDDTDIGFKVNPWVSYAYGIFTPKLGVTYVSNEEAAGKADDNYSFTIKPQVTCAVGPNASIEAAFAFTSYGDVAADAYNSGEDSKQVFYIDFLWKF